MFKPSLDYMRPCLKRGRKEGRRKGKERGGRKGRPLMPPQCLIPFILLFKGAEVLFPVLFTDT